MARRARGGKPSQALVARLRQVRAAIEEAQEHCFDALEADGTPRRLGPVREPWRHGRHEEAVAALRDMLRLTPNDDQGVRHLPMRRPLAFRRHGGGEAAALDRAVAASPHLLTGQAPMPKALPDACAWGGREEARLVAEEARAAWEVTAGARDWLRRHVPAPPRKGRSHARPGA